MSDFLAIIPPFYPKIRLKGLYLHIIIYQNPMRKNIFLFAAILSAFAFTSLCTPQAVAQKKSYTKKISQPRNEYVVATKHGVPADGKTDASEAIQKLIDNNPNRTIYFPDGIYLVSRPINTPADPQKSVQLVLSNYAVIKASGAWKDGGAVIKLGAIHAANDINTNGSNYGLYGGIIDGSGFADGVSIDGGRETKIENVSIKHTQIGVHVKRGANSGSSDADICDVNIVGNDKANSIGLLAEGSDNTFTNMRIASVNIGVLIRGGAGNSLRNIHPLYIYHKDQNYETSCGFVVETNNNWFNFCYSDQFATGFLIKHSASVNLTDCFCYWYNGKVSYQTAIRSEGKFNSLVVGIRSIFNQNGSVATLLDAEKGGDGALIHPVAWAEKLSDKDVSESYKK